MMSSLSKPTAAGVLFAVVVVLLFVVTVMQIRYERLERKYHDYKTEVAAANEKIAAENAKKLEEARANTAAVAEQYTRHYDAVVAERNSRIAGLRVEANHCAAVRSAASAAGQPDGAAADDRLGAAAPETGDLVSVCTRLEADCTATTWQLINLQDYVYRVCR